MEAPRLGAVICKLHSHCATTLAFSVPAAAAAAAGMDVSNAAPMAPLQHC
jgi:hypothetical protein